MGPWTIPDCSSSFNSFSGVYFHVCRCEPFAGRKYSLNTAYFDVGNTVCKIVTSYEARP